MELDKTTIKSLSSDTRIDILKSLGRRRKMPSELSKEFGLAPSTVVEHLKILEKSDLIKRQETGHKWIYYDLTDKGRSLVQPSSMKFVVILSVGFLMILGGVGIGMINYDVMFSVEYAPIRLAEPINRNSEAAQDVIVEDLKASIVEDMESTNNLVSNVTQTGEEIIEKSESMLTEEYTEQDPNRVFNMFSYLLVIFGMIAVLVAVSGKRKKIRVTYD